MGIVAIAVLFGWLGAPPPQSAVEVFNARLAAYTKARKDAVSNLPSLKAKATPEQIRDREQAFAKAIRGSRAGAQPGDVFTPEIRPLILSILKSEIKGPHNRDTRASIKEGNPRHEKAPGEVEPAIAVNAIYPKNSPLSTVPPVLLERLPQLPKELEYRFVGRTLILRDRDSSLIVDYLKEAVPTP